MSSINIANALSLFIGTCAFFIAAITVADVQPKVCVEIQGLLAARQAGRAPPGFEVDYRPLDGGDDIYPGLDIDSDGVGDHILRSCGASLDALCTLYIELSTGERLELEEERFFLVRVGAYLYVIVGEGLLEPEEIKRDKRRVYQVTKQAIKLICPHI
ncbi:hypothetical protein [Methylocaldum sp.]|uniref:hypothetical protein n=1 Tax=Methylocaldum sp. TaxID=1969727 RepID=UPI002D6094C0|nr:hypothetical protein [Methylocaldum sp.]HYE36877.1 hypothetical protein [Methylocaldum sp.]